MPTAVTIDLAMPRLSDSMEEGTIVRWMVEDGATVSAGAEIAEVETDKATMPFEAEAGGVLTIVAGEGDTVAVGALIARLAPEGSASAPASAPAPVVSSNGARAPEAAPRVAASPLARRIARERGIDLSAVQGSGRGGRIVRADVDGAAAAAVAVAVSPAAVSPAPAAVAAPTPAGGAKGDVEVVELTRTQMTVARRMSEAKATVPEFVLGRTVDMDAAVELRAMLRAGAPDARLPSYNDMVVRACALALRAFPRANGAYRDGHFELFGRVNVGIAVAAGDALLVPTIFDADIKSLGTIGQEARTLAARCRGGSITPPELAGGTFAVSNLGMFGVDRFTAVVNPPQAAILAVGALRKQPVVRDDALAVGHVMELSLTCDHRILYGAQGAELLGDIAQRLERPTALLL